MSGKKEKQVINPRSWIELKDESLGDFSRTTVFKVSGDKPEPIRMENIVEFKYRVIWCKWWVHSPSSKFYLRVTLLNDDIPKKYQIEKFDLDHPHFIGVGFGSQLIFSYVDILSKTICKLRSRTTSDFYQPPDQCDICGSNPFFYDDEICCPKCRDEIINADYPEKLNDNKLWRHSDV